MAGRLIKLARLQFSLQPNAYVEYGLITIEARNCSTPFAGVISRSYFSFLKGKGSNFQYEKPNVKAPIVDTKRLNFVASLNRFVHVSKTKYWPASWFDPKSGSLDLEKKKNFNYEAWILGKLRHMRLSSRCCDHDHHRGTRSVIRRNYKNGDKPWEGSVKYSVIRVDSLGTLLPLELSTSQLGLHPRDIDLLSSSTFIPQRATIAVRHDLVLVRMENVRAIVCKDYVLLFDARHPRTAKDSSLHRSAGDGRGNSETHWARDAFAKTLAEEAKRQPLPMVDPMPFHLRMVECLLEETSNFFHQKVDRLKLVVERMLEELTDDVSMGGLQRLLPLRRAVTEVEHDVRDAHEAMDQVLRSDDNLLALCLCRTERFVESGLNQGSEQDRVKLQGDNDSDTEDHRHHPMKQAAADMLLTYQREVDDAGGVLEELRKGMEAAQEIWELGLDTTRNRIMRANLYISVTTLSVTLATLPAAFFGMNLPSGYEERPTLFYWVVACGISVSMSLCIGILMGFRLWPKRVDNRRAQDLAGLVDLLQHLDSIDDIIQSVGPKVAGRALTREEFQQNLKSHPSYRFMRQKEVDLVFRMFDVNRDDQIQTEEWNHATSKHSVSPSTKAKKEDCG